MKIARFAIYAMTIALLGGCSAKTDTLFNREFQKIPTKYNVLFNGYEALEAGKKEVFGAYKDNYFQILPVEAIEFSDDIKLKGEENPSFARAEEKAVKAIQKHSMVFDGVQKNEKIDDAYILLGVARYYNRRYVPALEAFNHLLVNYGQTDRRQDAVVWKAKTQLAMGQEKMAIATLEEFQEKQEKIKKRDLAQIKATLAQGYVNLKQYEKATSNLKEACMYEKNKKTKGRYYFIIGQLYQRLQQKDSARAYFSKVVKLNRKVDRKMWIQANAGVVENSAYDQEYIKFLEKMEKQYENKNLLGFLYYQHAKAYHNMGDHQRAISYYALSLKKNKDENTLKEKSHRSLAELYFEKKDYIGSYTHYDSTLVYMPKNTLEHLYTRRKRDNISQIAQREKAVKEIDSTLSLASMDKEKRNVYFQKMADSLNNIAEKIDKNTTKTKQNKFFGSQGSDFYFYNKAALEKGKAEFEKKFGKRPLSDNWRWASVANMQDSGKKQEDEKTNQKQKIDAQFFESTLPEKEKLEQLRQERAKMLYELAMLYREKFNDNEIAVEKFEKVLEEKEIDQELREKTLYGMYQALDKLGRREKAQKYKKELIDSYGQSPYAKALKGEVQMDQNTLEEKLKQAQELAQRQQLTQALSVIEQNKTQYITQQSAYRWELLKAKILGRLEGIGTYKRELERFLENYPNTNATQEAKQTLENLPSEKAPEFEKDEKAMGWKIVFEWMDDFDQKKTREELDKRGLALVTISKDAYNRDEKWIVFHGLMTKNQAEIVAEEMKKDKKMKVVMIVSDKNYTIVQLYKVKKEYLNN